MKTSYLGLVLFMQTPTIRGNSLPAHDHLFQRLDLGVVQHGALRDRVLPLEDLFGDVRAHMPLRGTHVAVRQLVPGLGETGNFLNFLTMFSLLFRINDVLVETSTPSLQKLFYSLRGRSSPCYEDGRSVSPTCRPPPGPTTDNTPHEEPTCPCPSSRPTTSAVLGPHSIPLPIPPPALTFASPTLPTFLRCRVKNL